MKKNNVQERARVGANKYLKLFNQKLNEYRQFKQMTEEQMKSNTHRQVQMLSERKLVAVQTIDSKIKQLESVEA